MLFKVLTVIFSLIYGSSAFAVGATMHDPLSYERAFDILKTAKENVEAAKHMHEELKRTKAILGNFKEDGLNLREELTDWRNYYDNIDTLNADNFSAFRWLGVDKLHPDAYAPNTSGLLGKNFNSQQAFEDVKFQMFDDEKHPEELKYRRQELSQNSMATSVVISNESKKSLIDSKKKIMSLSDESISASDLLSAMKAQNKLLGVIASEMVQQRELQAQQLELIASFFAKFEGTGKLSDPAKRIHKKQPWD